MFRRKKPSSATTSTNSVASPSSATTSAVSKKQQFNNVPELSDAPQQPKKKFLPREFRNKKITKCSLQKDYSVAHPQIHYYETHDTEVASATTILSHNRLLKDITTRKMRLVSEQSARKSVNRQALLKILSNVQLGNGRRYRYKEPKQVKPTLTLIN